MSRGTNKASTIQSMTAAKLRERCWAHYLDPDSGRVSDFCGGIGISRTTYYRHVNRAIEEAKAARDDKALSLLRQASARAMSMMGRAADKYDDAEDPDAAAKWSGIVKDHRQWLTKINGWEAPTRFDVRNSGPTPEDVKLIEEGATVEELSQLRALANAEDTRGLDKLTDVILKRLKAEQ